MVIGDWREDYNFAQAALRARDEGTGRIRGRVVAPERSGAGRGILKGNGIRPGEALPRPPSHPPPSHSWWTDKRGPVKVGATVERELILAFVAE